MIVAARFHDHFHELIIFSCKQLNGPHLFVNLKSGWLHHKHLILSLCGSLRKMAWFLGAIRPQLRGGGPYNEFHWQGYCLWW